MNIGDALYLQKGLLITFTFALPTVVDNMPTFFRWIIKVFKFHYNSDLLLDKYYTFSVHNGDINAYKDVLHLIWRYIGPSNMFILASNCISLRIMRKCASYHSSSCRKWTILQRPVLSPRCLNMIIGHGYPRFHSGIGNTGDICQPKTWCSIIG